GVLLAIALVSAVYWFSRRRLSPQAELELAVRNREFIVHYQPIIELSTGVCVGQMIGRETATSSVIELIIDLTKKLDSVSVAEGVETEE
ncbi:hypothetical protein ABE580_20055, partial [Brucella pseudintermedia]